MISLIEFHQDFLQSILTDAESRGLMRSQAFFENTCEELVKSGDLTNNYTFAEYIKLGIEVYGYDYDEERKLLTVLVYEFFQDDEMQTLTKLNIQTKFNRLKTFVRKAFEGLYLDIEETSEAYSMAYNIFQYYKRKQIDKLRLMILTDGKTTRNLNNLLSEVLAGINTEFRVIDIEYIYKIILSEYINSDFAVEVDLPCLEVDTNSKEYKSYLTVLNGGSLVKIYEQFGQKLFEQNVRTFLQFRGKVNQGIRNTIENSPEKFFAYNNGITATATKIEFNEIGNIKKIYNFQIVNGGQTTSAIYAANKNSQINVSEVKVQMKLSVIKNKDIQNKFVSNVSEYANTQNKVNKSDFFSNSSFHKDMKNYSKRIWVPAMNGSQIRKHWFYERVRGEYLNEQAYLSTAQKKQFQLENPKETCIDKKILSKSENAWQQKPHIVSKGAEYSFDEFRKNITNVLEKNNLVINETYFKESVARIVLFKRVEKIVSEALWYDGGYRAQTVAYSVSYLSCAVESTGKYLNFELIWEHQKVPDKLVYVLNIITENVYNKIISPPKGIANVGQWCKQEKCWEVVKNMKLDINIDQTLLVDKEEIEYIKAQDRRNKKIENGIEIQILVNEIGKENWEKIYKYYSKYQNTTKISSLQLDILRKMHLGKLIPPSEKQAKILYKLYKDARNEEIV